VLNSASRARILIIGIKLNEKSGLNHDFRFDVGIEEINVFLLIVIVLRLTVADLYAVVSLVGSLSFSTDKIVVSYSILDWTLRTLIDNDRMYLNIKNYT